MQRPESYTKPKPPRIRLISLCPQQRSKTNVPAIRVIARGAQAKPEHILRTRARGRHLAHAVWERRRAAPVAAGVHVAARAAVVGDVADDVEAPDAGVLLAARLPASSGRARRHPGSRRRDAPRMRSV